MTPHERAVEIIDREIDEILHASGGKHFERVRKESTAAILALLIDAGCETPASPHTGPCPQCLWQLVAPCQQHEALLPLVTDPAPASQGAEGLEFIADWLTKRPWTRQHPWLGETLLEFMAALVSRTPAHKEPA